MGKIVAPAPQPGVSFSLRPSVTGIVTARLEIAVASRRSASECRSSKFANRPALLRPQMAAALFPEELPESDCASSRSFWSRLVGGSWYLAKRGFGRQWRYRVVEELRKHGVEASVRRLTLDPFRGLVAQDVRIFDYHHREKTLARISEIALDINYAALLHRQPFLNALDIRNAQLALPLKSPEGKPMKAQVTNIHAHVYFPPEQIYLSQAEGIFCGIRISATGQLIKREGYQPSAGISAEEWQSRVALFQRLVAELERFTYPGAAPRLQLKFTGDLAQLEDARVDLTLRADRIQSRGYEVKAFLRTPNGLSRN